jgi:zinc finger FYVE domain-containing protein 26
LFWSAVDIYAGVAASLAERKKGGQLTEFLKNIRGTIDDDEWDQVTFFLQSLHVHLKL